MTFVVPNSGELRLLRFITGNATPGTLTLRLYTNDVTPGESDVAGTYTEPVGNGYAAENLSSGSWTFATNAGVSTATHTDVTFTFSGGPVTLYGYFILDAGSNLLAAERFTGSSVTVPGSGGDVVISPVLGLD